MPPQSLFYIFCDSWWSHTEHLAFVAMLSASSVWWAKLNQKKKKKIPQSLANHESCDENCRSARPIRWLRGLFSKHPRVETDGWPIWSFPKAACARRILCVSKTLSIDLLHPLQFLTAGDEDCLGKGGFHGDWRTPKSSFSFCRSRASHLSPAVMLSRAARPTLISRYEITKTRA